jgi:hypothetical protein
MGKIRRFNEQNEESEPEDKRWVNDGVWDLEDIEVLDVETKSGREKAKEFKEKYPDWAIASPYDTMAEILLSRKPTKFLKYTDFSNSFEGHGSCAMIEDCPKRILILGQSD